MKKKIIAFSALLLAAACATSPTGRRQLLAVPDGQMNAMGAQAFDDLKTKEQIETDPKTVQYVQCLAKNITEQVKGDIDPKSWEVVVFRNKQVNAFALPGSKIGVFTGIIPVASTPNQLAAVMGHEVAHVIVKHGTERYSQALAVAVGAQLAGLNNPKTSTVLRVVAGLGSQVGLMKFSRDHESEADILGLEYMAKAGFDPRESVTLWQNMAKAGGGQPPEFLSTHPSHNTRIKNLQEKMPEAIQMYEKAKAEGRNPGCTI